MSLLPTYRELSFMNTMDPVLYSLILMSSRHGYLCLD